MQLIKISKFCIYIVLFYIIWFIYFFGEKTIILYGSTILVAACVLTDIFIKKISISNAFPNGVIINLIMCVYSLIIGLFVASNLDSLVNAVKTYAAYTIICLAICYISKEEKSFVWLLNAIIIVDIVSAINIIVKGFYIPGYGYVLSSSQNPNVLGVSMIFGLFCVAYKNQNENKNRWVNYIIAGLFVYIIIGCGSRKSLLAAIGICFVWAILTIYQHWVRGDWAHRTALLLFVGILIFLLVYYYNNIYINTNIYNRMEVLGDGKDESSRLRELYYEYALDFFYENPIFGIGFAQFAVRNPIHAYAHSTYAEVFADWGFVGSVIFFVPVLWAGVELIKRTSYESVTNTAIIVLALWIIEVFLGIGQIWFYLFEHLIVWTVIYLYIDLTDELIGIKKIEKERKFKYVKI